MSDQVAKDNAGAGAGAGKEPSAGGQSAAAAAAANDGATTSATATETAQAPEETSEKALEKAPEKAPEKTPENALEGGNPEPAAAQLTFKVKAGPQAVHPVTIAETATVLDLKKKLAGSEYEGESVPPERQRLIYSGRVMKNDEPLSTYKIKNNNTIHMVKSAVSNTANGNNASDSSAARPAQAVPSHMAAGTDPGNLLTGLTGARFAGLANLPGADMFGADGGMGAPPDEEDILDMLADPAFRQHINEALDNPSVMDTLISSNPMLSQMPNARQFFNSPVFRAFIANPDTARAMIRLRRGMNRALFRNGGFPAPGATDSTPDGAPAGSGANNAEAGVPADLLGNMLGLVDFQNSQLAQLMGGMPGAPAAHGVPDPPSLAAGNPFLALFPGSNITAQGAAGPSPTTGAGATAATAAANPAAGDSASAAGAAGGTGSAAAPATGGAQTAGPPAAQGGPPPVNASLASLLGLPPSAADTAGSLFNAPPANQFSFYTPGGPGGANPAMLQALGQALANRGLGQQPPPAPVNARPPEELYADQLRQLNDMGFYDFERNVAALRRSGGNVEGALEYLLR